MPDYDAEHSEAVLYHVRVLEELEETEEALRLLDISAKSRAITDRVAIMETRGTFLYIAFQDRYLALDLERSVGMMCAEQLICHT